MTLPCWAVQPLTRAGGAARARRGRVNRVLPRVAMDLWASACSGGRGGSREVQRCARDCVGAVHKESTGPEFFRSMLRIEKAQVTLAPFPLRPFAPDAPASLLPSP